MNRAPTAALALLLCGLTPSQSVNARPQPVNRLTSIRIEGGLDAFEIVASASAPLLATQLSIYGEGRAIHLDLLDAQTQLKRPHTPTPTPEIKRAAIKSLKGARPLTRLTLRLKRALPPEVIAEASVVEEGGALLISIPKSEAIAKRWARMRKAKALSALDARLEATPAPQPTPQPAPPRPSVHVNASAPLPPLDAGSEATPLGLAEPHAALSAEAPLTAGLAAQPPAAMGKVAMVFALLLLTGAGLFLWRKIQPHREGQGERLIRQVGHHALGPKQSLVLLDVVGQMVLVGTSDKGVQMLTKIEPSPPKQAAPTPAKPPRAPRYEARRDEEIVPTSDPLPDEALSGGFADSLSRAFAKIRMHDVAAAPRPQPAAEEATRGDDLAALCDAVTDKAPALAPAPPDLLRRLREQSGRH
ncbi:flagellar biosynthetic protein FliO [Myxococcota bacterium]|nr:flagellar biosynthetic protein FliO [Myxococcota bacterium]MBU1429359.1 flagellar biosynthetic protein FliO [Myxococcota bacterium]MBU1899890.1 flagellar biosynthetic protein FliO [Myxococcota bacterium]